MNDRSNAERGRGAVLAIGLCGALAAVWSYGGPAESASVVITVQDAGPAASASASSSSSASSSMIGAAVGDASCARRGCHGNVNNVAVDRGGELSHFLRRDPHTRGYRVLEGALSLRILDHLAREERLRTASSEADLTKKAAISDADAAKARQAVAQSRCLPCHSYYGGKPSAAHDSAKFNAGIGCETCHGPASGWLNAHYQKDWAAKTAAEKTLLGMNDTKSLAARARMCAGCHVGDSNRDMNHDLIAAGHPRLNFEYAAYLSDLDAHWRKETRDKDYGVQAWRIGRLASAVAALDLLRSRAERAKADNAPWPEFSEHNCFACHKEFLLNDGLYDPAKNIKPANDLSALPWGSWHFDSELRDLIAKESAKSLDALRKEMETRLPDPEKVRTLCDSLIKTLQDEVRKLDGAPAPASALDPAGVRNGLAALAGQTSASSRDWDRLAQEALRLSAALEDPALAKQAQEDAKRLKAYAEGLEFPKGFASPARWWRGKP